MSRRSIVRPALATLALAATFGLAVPSADACGGGWWPEDDVDHRVMGIARAEKMLEEGKYDDAAASIIRMMPHIKGFTTITRESLISRAQRVLAVATARKGGKLDIQNQLPEYLHESWLGQEASDREANLAWSVAALEKVAAVKKSDAVVESELAEAMAKSNAHRAAGKKKLEELANKDLLTSPEGWAELAELRKGSGDRQGSDAAIHRCRAMAKDATVCGQAAPSAQS
jgi:hypothetical protein